MFPEVGDVFGVREVFFLRVYRWSIPSAHRSVEGVGKEQPTLIVELFEMMDFVLVLVVAVVSWSGLEFQTRISMAFIIFAEMVEEVSSQKDIARALACPGDFSSVKASG